MGSYSTRVGRDIRRWADRGLIDAATADALSRDVAANERHPLNFGSILAMLAAVLFGAAILLFVAANWETIPRIVRVGLLFAIIFAGYVGGAVLKVRVHPALGEALWVVATAAFGGAIALIGQMYHLAGDESSALLTWCGGTVLAAILLRSNALTVIAVAIADAWFVIAVFGRFDLFRGLELPHPYVLIAIGLFIVSYWTRSQPARHLIVLSLIFYVLLLTIDDDRPDLAILLSVVSAAAFAVAVFAGPTAEVVVRLGGRLSLHALAGFLAGMFAIQFYRLDHGNFALAAALTLAGIVAALVLVGRQSRAVRWLAYLGFAFELCLIYAVTMQSMLGTAGFFLAAAIILAVLALAIARIEKRMKAPAIQGAA
ncbi:DUF2157 domain-containing protein [Manganibacter manganicus]|uniref:DUF2157 domain-containing protein n=1 Tax=Manganibacter manganicus TaxID=1873176 RepID=A0A1V8RUD4_9HYPH|nr:DUF2157 domain-containing protein [Pseudaminobacter manganicus]OQM76792.1 hypothetical protein BFN67_12865 [Pseudaminobacter manganicus]